MPEAALPHAGLDPAGHRGTPTPASASHAAQWQDGDDGWVLRLVGDWRGQPATLPPLPPSLQTATAEGRLRVEGSALTGWDARLASALWQRLRGLDRTRLRLDLDGLPPGLQRILALALPASTTAAPANTRRRRRPHWVTALGQRAGASGEKARQSVEIVGSTLLAAARLLRGRSDMRLADLAWQLEQTGPRSLPIIVLVSFLVGLIVAYMGAAQLERFGAQSYVADLVTVGVVREIAALLVGIVLAGRIGAAFAAQLGSMRANEEIDALQTLGIDPVEHLVLPRVLALLIVGPLLTAFAALVGMGVGWLVAVGLYGVSPLEYVFKSLQALTGAHVGVGLLKGTVYAVLVGLAGCRQGLAAGRSAQAVGDATTAAVVQSIVWIVVAASTLTVIFQRLDV